MQKQKEMQNKLRSQKEILEETTDPFQGIGGNQNTSKMFNNSLELEFIYGYRGIESRDNIQVTRNQELVYYASRMGIVYNPQTHTQRFFFGHTTEITCLTLHPNGHYVATGQYDDEPLIFIWDSETGEKISRFKTSHDLGIASLSFSSDGKYLFCVSMDELHYISIWDCEKKKMICFEIGDENKILCSYSNPFIPNQFITCGIKNLRFWQLNKNRVTSERADLSSKGEIVLHSLIMFDQNSVITGTSTGEILVWDLQTKSIIKTFRAHAGPCFALHTTKENVFLSGGKDGKVILWDNQTFSRVRTITKFTGGPIRAIDLCNNKIYAGTLKNEIWEADLSTDEAKTIICPHGDEVWGLATHPTLPQFITASDDRSIRYWDASEKTLVSKISVNGQPRYVTYSYTGDLIAIGLRDGEFIIYQTGSLKQVANRKDMICSVTYMTFSPNDQKFAIGFEDGTIMIHNSQSSFRKSLDFKIQSKVLAIDWSVSSDCVRVSDGKSISFFTAEENMTISDFNSINWASFNCLTIQQLSDALGFSIGLNSICAWDNSPSIRLYDYPIKNSNNFQKISGHNSAVTAVRFLQNSRVISVGGQDMCVFQWVVK
eukprot:Anaeramoba_ignava/a483397_44.p1 GENE.a483397_44~~a483397_44.p1  ORF type:complete len:679 (-),score=213.38 a483397_44:41-1843(-)